MQGLLAQAYDLSKSGRLPFGIRTSTPILTAQALFIMDSGIVYHGTVNGWDSHSSYGPVFMFRLI